MEPTSAPHTYTVEEAARLLRIGRTTAYALVKERRVTGGRSGIPVLELGRTLRVPRAALDRLLNVDGAVVRPDDESLRGLYRRVSSGALTNARCGASTQPSESGSPWWADGAAGLTD